MRTSLRWLAVSTAALFVILAVSGAARHAAAQTAAADPAARSARWHRRDAPESVAAAAKEFLNLLVLDETERRSTGLFTRKELAEVDRLQQAGQFAAGMEVFARYFIDKLRYPTRYGISPFDVDPFTTGVCGGGGYPSTLDPKADPAAVLATAEKLLHNVLALGGKEVDLGPPGTVNWNHPFGPEEAIPPDEQPVAALISGQGFSPLVHAYLLTHDERYLDKWIEFMDDWSQNCRYVDTIHPCIVPDSAGGSIIPMLRLLGGLARARPADRPVVPPRVLAQMLRKRLCEYELCNLAYVRSNTHNWTPSPCQFLTAMLLDEFKAAPRLLRKARRRNIEDNAVTQNLRDGSENQQCPWYNQAYLYVAGALRLLEARATLPSWADVRWLADLRGDVAWQTEIREHLRERMTYLIHPPHAAKRVADPGPRRHEARGRLGRLRRFARGVCRSAEPGHLEGHHARRPPACGPAIRRNGSPTAATTSCARAGRNRAPTATCSVRHGRAPTARSAAAATTTTSAWAPSARTS